jgi:hypothetical protein
MNQLNIGRDKDMEKLNKSHEKLTEILKQQVPSECPELSKSEATSLRKELKKVWRKLHDHIA